jgi:hypothetical protein
MIITNYISSLGKIYIFTWLLGRGHISTLVILSEDFDFDGYPFHAIKPNVIVREE